jgi:hypothetical protein
MSMQESVKKRRVCEVFKNNKYDNMLSDITLVTYNMLLSDNMSSDNIFINRTDR